MSDILQFFGQLAEKLITLFGYPGIAIVTFLENLFPPLPSELIVPFAGFQAASGQLGLVGVIIASTVGSVGGALVLYGVGAWWGEEPLRRLIRRYGRYVLLTEGDLDKVLSLFENYGSGIILFGRLVPGLRSYISIPAGMRRMPIGRFILFTALGTALWSGIMAYAGYMLGENWDQVVGYVNAYQQIITVLTVVVTVGFVVTRLRNLRRQSVQESTSANEIPSHQRETQPIRVDVLVAEE
ncbi:MAG: DedA family protein [Anaerolineae bacterium]|nr:DedA family protein [Anaerolineae bacterium]